MTKICICALLKHDIYIDNVNSDLAQLYLALLYLPFFLYEMKNENNPTYIYIYMFSFYQGI